MKHNMIENVIKDKNYSDQAKIDKLKRMAYDTAEMQVADSENMGSVENGQPGLDEIVDAINKLSGENYKVSDFYQANS